MRPRQSSEVIAPENNRRSLKKFVPADMRRIKEIYEWTVQDFSNQTAACGESINSVTFSGGPENKDKWYLELFPTGRDKECRDYFSLYLMLKSTKRAEVQLLFQLSIINVASQDKIASRSVQRKFVSGMSVGWRQFVKREDILLHASDFLVNDELRIRLEFDYDLGAEKSSSEASVKDIPVVKDLWLFFEASKFTDCVIVVGEKSFHSHKLMLAARSSVFCEMIEKSIGKGKPEKEREYLRMEIDGIEPEIFRGILQFIYTGSIGRVEPVVEELLAAADRFNLTQLRTICEAVFIEKLSVINAADILVTADQYNAMALKEQVIAFINDHLAEVVESPSYKVLEERHTELLRGIVRAQVARIKVKNLLEGEAL